MQPRRHLANALRALSMDAIQQAKSGHPGAPLGMADIAEVLWNDFLVHNPANPTWPDRDRFVLSNGHGSMLLYALLHLSGYDLGIEDLKSFRQLGACTAGHPEYGLCPGVETTTGPLGQGLANAVGMALAEKVLAGQFNRPGHAVVDHYTYVFMGDGCLMEGVSHEAASLAGTLGLGKLVAFWDDNGISIDGHVSGWFADDTPARFTAYGWHVVAGVDGHDAQAVRQAVLEARSVNDRPSLVCCRTVIGFGAPNVCGSHDCHGSPLGETEIAATRANLDWPHPPFAIPADVAEAWNARDRGQALESAWNERFAAYAREYPDLAEELSRRLSGRLPDAFADTAGECLRRTDAAGSTLATRKASQLAIEGFGPHLPEFFGGSADLTSSNLTNWSGSKAVNGGIFDGNYLSYGVREFAMAAMMNGMALHGGFLPYGGTFLVFSDYARNALRMAALMGLRVIHVLTHDSIGVGEDGPTHQPVEHVASLRLIPNMSLWRPCDAVETAAAWKSGIMRDNGPTCLILSRQNLPHQVRDEKTMADMERGGYVLRDCEGAPEAVILASGSEVAPALEAAGILTAAGRRARVVSMPCLDRFEAQDAAYKASVLPPAAVYAAVEAGSPESWFRYVGRQGIIVGMESFGESAPGPKLFEHFGFSPEAIAQAVERGFARRSS